METVYAEVILNSDELEKHKDDVEGYVKSRLLPRLASAIMGTSSMQRHIREGDCMWSIDAIILNRDEYIDLYNRAASRSK